jgi:hypothetical protein
MTLLALLIVGCHGNQPLGPPIPTGATILGDSTMTSAPPPPPGWQEHVATPTSQQQAQDTVLEYIKRTLAALPPGVVFDASRYSGGTTALPCNDAPLNTNPPVEFTATGDLTVPSEVDADKLIAETGGIWKSWGWWVFERDDFSKPNRFGYAPDGYILHIEVSSPPGYSPSVVATSPCFPHDIARNDVPFPRTITAEGG